MIKNDKDIYRLTSLHFVWVLSLNIKTTLGFESKKQTDHWGSNPHHADIMGGKPWPSQPNLPMPRGKRVKVFQPCLNHTPLVNAKEGANHGQPKNLQDCLWKSRSLWFFSPFFEIIPSSLALNQTSWISPLAMVNHLQLYHKRVV